VDTVESLLEMPFLHPSTKQKLTITTWWFSV